MNIIDYKVFVQLFSKITYSKSGLIIIIINNIFSFLTHRHSSVNCPVFTVVLFVLFCQCLVSCFAKLNEYFKKEETELVELLLLQMK